MYGGNIILVAIRDVLSFALVYPDSFPAESTCVSFGRHSVNCARVVAQRSVYCARVVRHIRCLFSVPLQHEYEELKEGIWLEPALELLRKKTEKHRNVARKLVLEGGWVQKKVYDTGWSDESKCQACHKEEGTEKHRLYHCREWHEVRQGIPEAFRKWEQKAETSKKEWKWQRGVVTHPLSESQWNRGHFSMTKSDSEKHRSRCMPAKHEETKSQLCYIDGRLSSQKFEGVWTGKHRNVARKTFLEGGWTHKRLFDIGWSDVSQCQACRWWKAQRSTGFTTVRNGTE